MTATDRFVVFTGGPGSGKTTLLEALALDGVALMPEAGRAIIQDQVSIGGTALPWGDRPAFAELMLGWELRSWREASHRVGLVLFDRGVPDVIGYLRHCGLPVPAHMLQAAEQQRYHRLVFIAPPWPEIFTHDSERTQSLQEAEATYFAMARTYRELGYELVHLPLVPVTDRVRFVRSLLPQNPR